MKYILPTRILYFWNNYYLCTRLIETPCLFVSGKKFLTTRYQQLHSYQRGESTQLTRGLFFNQCIYPLLHFLRTTKNMLKKKERKEQTKKHYYSSARTICLLRKEQLPFLYAYILLQPYISPFFVGMYWKFCFTGEQKQLELQIWQADQTHEFHPYVQSCAYQFG